MSNDLSAPSKSKVLIAYGIIYIVWGSTFFFIHKALSYFTPFVLGSLRFITAALVLFIFCKIKGYKLYSRKAVLNSFVVGFLLLFVDMGCMIWAEQYVSSGIAAIMAAATAIWFIILDKSKWRENFSNIAIVLGLIAGFVGVIMLFAEQINIAGDESQKFLNIICMVILILGSIAWTVGSLYSKYTSTKGKDGNNDDDLNVMVKASWQMLIAGVSFSIVASVNGEFREMDFVAVNIQGWLCMLFLILFGSILAFSSYIWLLQVRPSTEVSTYAYVNPIVAVALSFFFTDDIITHLQILGLIVILMSVLLMNWNLYSNSKWIKLIKVNVKKKRRKMRILVNSN